MKLAFYSIVLVLISSLISFGQKDGAVERILLLSPVASQHYAFDKEAIKNIREDAPTSFSTLVPVEGQNKELTFSRIKVFSDAVILSTASGQPVTIDHLPISYHSSQSTDHFGILNINRNGIKINYSDISGDILINLRENEKPVIDAIPEEDVVDIGCATEDSGYNTSIKHNHNYKSEEVVDLRLYIQVDYQLYLDNGSDVAATVDWVNALFSQVSALFAIHNIELLISQILIWDIPDPYQNTPDLSSVLFQLADEVQNEFSGDVAQLLTSRQLGGGKANLDKICVPYDPEDSTGPYAVSASLNVDHITSTSYSFSTFVTAHEIGHVVGSPHSHACAWGPNNDEALDNCFAPEGGCPLGPETDNGGAIMSYCFINPNIGINYNHGFGAEPGALMHSRLFNSNCNNDCAEGQPCNDGDTCTANDQYDESCNCIGALIDYNMNELCDLTEQCEAVVNVDTLTNPPIAILASDMIISSTAVEAYNTLSSGQAVELYPGFEVDSNTLFQVYNSGCEETGNP